jgi:hypothetical protein
MSSYLALSREEMIEVSRKWITPTGVDDIGKPIATDRPLIESISVAAALLPVLIEAHQDLLAPIEPNTLSTEVIAIRKRQAELDLRHDDLIRGLHGTLGALAILVGPGPLRNKFFQLQEKMFPDGLMATRASYTQEAGAVRILENKLSPAEQSFLSGLMLIIPSGAAQGLLIYVQELISKGKELGVLEDQKNKLLESQALQYLPTETALARQWNQVVILFESNLRIAKVNAEDRETLLGPLHLALSRAQARQREQEEKKSTPESDPSKP